MDRGANSVAKYSAQLQPNYPDNHKIVVWYTSKQSLIEDLLKALEPLGIRASADKGIFPGNADHYIQTAKGDLSLMYEDGTDELGRACYTLRPRKRDAIIFEAQTLLRANSNFEMEQNGKFPGFAPLEIYGYCCLGIIVVIFLALTFFGGPTLGGQFTGVPLATIGLAISAFLILNYGGIKYLIERSGDKFPDPIDLNQLALVFAGVYGLLFFVLK